MKGEDNSTDGMERYSIVGGIRIKKELVVLLDNKDAVRGSSDLLHRLLVHRRENNYVIWWGSIKI